jgi:ribosomal protein S21
VTTVIVEPGEPFEQKPSVKRKRKALVARKRAKRRERFVD